MAAYIALSVSLAFLLGIAVGSGWRCRGCDFTPRKKAKPSDAFAAFTAPRQDMNPLSQHRMGQ